MAGEEVLVTPPIRQSVEDANSAQANGIAQPMTEKSWYLFWDRLGKMANRQNWMVNVGTHADRPPAANMPNGAIYVEFDRGVIYQNWSGAWQYLAGTMWGTLAPDQRPTDLGSHDSGFDFRTTDQPPREFIWSGTAWVEATPVTVGTHANRPAAAGEAEGNLYVEYDRGAIYQNWVGGWEYLAGTMWGTLSPDQRPTDLTSRDAGFDFRTTDAPPREFIWSGSAWIEIGAEYLVNGTLIGTRPALNLIAGSNVTISGADNAGSDRVDITVSSTGGGSGGTGVSSFNTRTGAVVPVAGDYTAAQVTNAVSTASTYADPAWVTALAWSKITGAPSVSSYQTPWLSNINAATFNLNNAGHIGVGTASPTAGVEVTAGGVRVSGGTTGSVTNSLAMDFNVNGRLLVQGPTTTTYNGFQLIQVHSDGSGQINTISVDASGRTGIGNITPTDTLTVNGCVRIMATQLTNVANTMCLDYAGGYGRLISCGPNTTTSNGFQFITLHSDGSGQLTPITISGVGNVGIGMVPVNYQFQLSSDSAAKLTTSTWTIASGAGVKQNIKPLVGGLEIINRLAPKEAEYNGLYGTPKGQRVVSLIAEEVREVLPHTVTENGDGSLGFNIHEVIHHLILAVQQLSGAMLDKPKS